VPRSSTRVQFWVALVLSIATPVGLVAYELSTHGFDARKFDWLVVSSYSTIVAALWLARGEHHRFRVMAERLQKRGVLVARDGTPLEKPQVEALVEGLMDIAKRRAWWAGVATGLAALGITALIENGRGWPHSIVVTGIWLVLSAGAGTFVGRALGRISAYGWLNSPLLRGDYDIKVKPRHPDKAAGLRPFGEFYFTQALLLAIPLAFLLVWSVLFYLEPFETRYDDWRTWYVLFIAVVILLQIGMFVRPLWGAHVSMRRQKEELYLAAADRQAELADDIRERLRGELDPEERKRITEQSAFLKEDYVELDGMPTWPLDPSLRRRFTLQGVAFALPLGAEAIRSMLGLS
jgi:hypothetical protein